MRAQAARAPARRVSRSREPGELLGAGRVRFRRAARDLADAALDAPAAPPRARARARSRRSASCSTALEDGARGTALGARRAAPRSRSRMRLEDRSWTRCSPADDYRSRRAASAMGRAAYLATCEAQGRRIRSCRRRVPCSPSRSRRCALAVGRRTRAPRLRPADAARAARSRCRTSTATPSGAVAVDLATGARRLRAQPDARARARVDREARAHACGLRSRSGPAFRIDDARARRWAPSRARVHGDLVLKGYGDPTLSRAELRRLAAQVRGARHPARDRPRSSATSRSSTRAGPRRAGSRRTTSTSRRRSRRSPSTAAATRGRVSRAARARRRARSSARRSRAAGVARRRAARPSAPRAAEARRSRASHSPPLRRARCAHGPRERQLHRRDPAQAARRGSRAARHDAAGARRRPPRARRRRRLRSAGVRIADGSGLSLLDRLTADALVAHPRAAWDDPLCGTASSRRCAVAGRSGTLEHRLRRRRRVGAVRAKTGTTARASALSGYRAGALRVRDRPERLARPARGGRARRRTGS